MRNWLFHPLLFYPLVLALAAGVIVLSLKPQALPRDPAPIAGRADGATLVLEREAFDTPEDPPEQYVTVVRDFTGAPQSLRIAVLPSQPPPQPGETGVLIRLTPAAAALISGKPLTVDIAYRPLPVNAAPELAVSVQGARRTRWVTRPIPPLAGSVQFNLPAQADVRGVALRPVSGSAGMSYGVEIVSIRITPSAGRRQRPN